MHPTNPVLAPGAEHTPRPSQQRIEPDRVSARKSTLCMSTGVCTATRTCSSFHPTSGQRCSIEVEHASLALARPVRRVGRAESKINSNVATCGTLDSTSSSQRAAQCQRDGSGATRAASCSRLLPRQGRITSQWCRRGANDGLKLCVCPRPGRMPSRKVCSAVDSPHGQGQLLQHGERCRLSTGKAVTRYECRLRDVGFCFAKQCAVEVAVTLLV
jgi:hypothetical protein